MKQCDKKSLLTLCLGAAGMSLRLLQNLTGFEPGTGLPIPGSIPGILLPVLLALSAVMLFRMNSKLPKGPVEVPLSRLLNWNDKEGLFGILAGGCVMAFSGVLEIANAFGRTVTAVSADGMEIVTVSAGAGRSGVVMGLLAVVAGICLLAGVAICRKTPDTEPQILLAVPVLLLARLIFAYRLYSVDPVLANYYLELLGLMLLILASYRLSGFAVQAGGPRMFGFYADLTAILAVTLLADDKLDDLLDKLSGYAKPDQRILLLARYHHLKPEALEKAATRWPHLQLDFMTIHASKGQQADYVIVLGLQEGEDAFPAPARESIMEQALLPQPEDFPDAEERRLLYVAITRARHRVWLLFNKAQPSPFVDILQALDVPVARKP